MKLYEKNFANVNFGREIINGFNLNVNAEYSERKPLFNNARQTAIKTDDIYTSNNPLLPFDFVTPAFEKHNLAKMGLLAKINFGQQYQCTGL